MVHAPQFFGSEPRSTSQPSRGSLLQSPHPASQASTWQAPCAHWAVAWAGAQATPHAPQLAVSAAVLVSQPLASWASQSAQGNKQVSMPQAPPAHIACACGIWQALLQVPQSLGLASVCVSQPSR
jgi:hypothetical protein